MSGPDEKARLILELRQAGITDMSLLSAMERLPREEFLPDEHREDAYAETALSIGCGQKADPPLLVARMTVALQPDERTKVLEIGTGTGYHAAVLAGLCRRVYTIERHRQLLTKAATLLNRFGLHNVTTLVGDGLQGWPHQAPFDRILVTGAATEPPPPLLAQLAPDGIMVIPIGPRDDDQQLLRFHKTPEGTTCEVIELGRFAFLEPGLGRDSDAID